MLLSELLRPDLISTNLDAQSKRQAIGELVDLLIQQNEIPMKARAEVIEAILEQEKVVTSGMEDGIALPHGATDRVEDIVCALGISRTGIDFTSRDGEPTRIVVLLVVPRGSLVGEVRALAGVQHLLNHDHLRKALLEAPDAKTAFELIEKEDHPAED